MSSQWFCLAPEAWSHWLSLPKIIFPPTFAYNTSILHFWHSRGFLLCHFLGESAVSTEQPLSQLILHETFGEETSLVYFNVPRWRLSDTNGGLRKKWCQSWHCDGSLNSTLVLKVFQVSKNAFLSWANIREGKGPLTQFEKYVSIFIIGENWEHILWNRQPGDQARNVSIILPNLNHKKVVMQCKHSIMLL